MLKTMRSKIIHAKIFLQRSMSYISLVNSAMILFILLSNLEEYGINIRIEYWFFPIVILGVMLLILFGYIEDRLGFYEEESKVATKRTPQIKEIIERLDRIEKNIEKIQNENKR